MKIGLTKERRVVLDLAFCGYGLSSEIVSRGGELLGIADPAAKFDPVPGARVARVELGIGLERLLKAGARFDLIVCDIPPGSQCAAVGAFAPPPALYAPGVRRILGCTPPAPKPPARVGLAVSVFTAIQALLADNGEALVRVPVADCGAINSDSKLLKSVWWAHRHGSVSDAYLRRAKKIRTVLIGPINREPNATDRCNMFGPESGRPWTPGQMQIFKETLLP
jgi:hypothetical protein